MDEREKAMEIELRKELPVTIDDAALGAVKIPDAPPAPPGSAGK